jgi:CheY-like chemotaxis protein
MLAVIFGHAELALMKIDPSQPYYADLQEIRKAADRSASLTRQLLAFARKQTIAPRVLNLNETVNGMLNMLRKLIGEDIDLSWQPGEGVWPLKVDPSQIDQILANLCVNARDAIADVGRIIIKTGTDAFDEDYCTIHRDMEPGEYVCLSVSDNGCGMDRETLANVFEPFFTTKELGKGTGLGLATVFGIVKQNNGFINVYSKPGKGTTFTIYLPRYTGEVQAQADVAARKSPGGNETILLVEDEPGILNMVRIMLMNLGYTVLVASSPVEAISMTEKYARGDIHMIITDVVMPEMNGYDLVRILSSIYPGLKSLFMSGYATSVIANHGLADGRRNFIQKPFSIMDLAAKVREVLDGGGEE